MSNATRPQPSKTDGLTLSSERLQQVLARDATTQPREWMESLNEALLQVEKGLRKYLIVADSPVGPQAEIEKNSPRLARKMDGVCKGFGDYLEQSIALREEVRRLTVSMNPAASDLAALRQLAEQFLDELEHIRDTESELILESANTELGAGD